MTIKYGLAKMPFACLTLTQEYRHTRIIFNAYFFIIVSRDSSVGIATRYGLDGPGIEDHRGRDFPLPSRPALGPTHIGYRVSTGSKVSEAWR